MNCDTDVLCITETFLNPTEITNVCIMNYKLAAHYSRTTSGGGGACIYVREPMVIIERNEVTNLSVELHLEACAIECVGLGVIIICIYRPPTEHVNQQIRNNSTNMCRSVWRVIASETGRTDNNKCALDFLVSGFAGDCDRERACAAATALNEFYLQVNHNSAAARPDIHNATSYLHTYLSNHTVTPLHSFRPVSIPELIKIIKSIKRKNSSDINDMSTKIFDLLPPVVVSLLCFIINQCIELGVYPDTLKHTKIQPIYKGKGELNVLKHYRPIALIPLISKPYERLISDRLMAHINTSRLLNPQQYAYQPGRSTVDAARDVVEKVMGHLDGGRRVAAIFCDLSRAFELVNHQLLLEKLHHYGLTGKAHLLIESFLNHRKQLTSVRGAHSELLELSDCSVPQGSIMGNNLFLILMNDFTTASNDADFVLFADDGCVIVTSDSLTNLSVKLNSVMSQLSGWFDANGMILNVEKTNIVRFNLSGRKCPDFVVKCKGLTVPQVNEIKYLGFTIDSGLTWTGHIDSVCNRLSSACFALGRLRPTLSQQNLAKAYYGYFHSILAYGTLLWATAADHEKVFRKQKRAVRILSGAKWDHHARDLFVELKILTLPSLYILEVSKLVRRNLSDFPTRADVHHYNVRGRNDLRAPHTRLKKSNSCLHTIGPKIYNKIPIDIKSAPSEIIFVGRLKDELLKHAFYSLDEFLKSKLI
ncbi:hypothetical protein O0L34_g1561 [Tuta absoluta]|nr:hypothetical protein O0L34_g1561 [Tuta absoluta]